MGDPKNPKSSEKTNLEEFGFIASERKSAQDDLSPLDYKRLLEWGERPNTTEAKKEFSKVLEGLPSDYAERYRRLTELRHAFLAETAAALEPNLNEHLKSVPQDSYDEKRALATWVNEQLRGLGLAIRCPKTGRPANLFADFKQAGSDISRFRLEIRDERGKKQRTIVSRTLPQLELMEDAARQEPLMEWSRRVQADRANEGPGPKP